METYTLALGEFKKFTSFILSDPNTTQAVLERYAHDVQHSGIPLLAFFNHLPAEEFRKICDESIGKFLQEVMEDKAFSQAIQSIDDWKAGNLAGIPREKIEINDIVRVYGLRKMLFLDFLPKYTTDVACCIAITKELERFHNHLEEYAFQTFVDIQQEELFKEKEFISSLINNSVDGILAFDTSLHITEWNRTLEQWNKLTKANVLGKKIFDLFPQYEHTDEGRAMKTVFDGHPVYITDKPFQSRKGYYEANILPLYDKQGAIKGGVSIIHDISVRKEAEHLIHLKNQELAAALEELTSAEEQLRETNEELERRVDERTHELAASEEELRQTLEKMIELNETLAEHENFLNSVIAQSPLSTWIADERGVQIQVNQACLDLFDIPDPSLSIGKYNILEDEVLKNTPFYQDIVDVFKKGNIVRFELEYDISQLEHVRFPEGKPLYIKGTIFPIKNAEGRVTHAVIQHEDVTERRKAELALRRSEEQLRLITDALPVLISYIDKEKKYRFVNQAYAEWFHKTKDEILGKSVDSIIGPNAYKNVVEHLEKGLSGEVVNFETKQDYGQLGERYIRSSLIPHRVGEEIKGIYALVFDISDRKKTEQTLERLYQEVKKRNKDLKRINTDLDNFVYTASHDLKSPVSNLEGLLQMMSKSLEQKTDANEGKILQMMKLSIGKLKRTIEDLVEITKVQKEMEQQVFEKICFKQVVEDVKTDLKSLLEESHADIKEAYGVKEIHYPKSHLRSIIYNLLSNALKYRAPERKAVITISTFAKDHQTVLSIRDNGLGMTETQQKKLFTMFKRMHTHVEGTGIGLYTIKRIIENNGGIIQVTSQAGAGTEFLVWFEKNSPEK